MTWGEQRARYGWLGALQASLFRLLERRAGIHVHAVIVRTIDPGYQLPQALADRFDFRRFTLEEALAATRDPRLALSEAFVRAAFARGDIGLGVWDGDRVAGYTWRSLTELPFIPGIRARITGPGLRCGYKSLIHPDYRGQRLNIAVARFWDSHFLAMGIDRSIGYVTLHNLASLRSIDRVGDYQRIGSLIAIPRLRLGGKPFVWRSPGASRVLAFDAGDDYRAMA